VRGLAAGGYSDLQEGKRTELKFRVTGYLLAFFISWVSPSPLIADYFQHILY
jgi:hypothetical protein